MGLLNYKTAIPLPKHNEFYGVPQVGDREAKRVKIFGSTSGLSQKHINVMDSTVRRLLMSHDYTITTVSNLQGSVPILSLYLSPPPQNNWPIYVLFYPIMPLEIIN